MKPAFFFYLVLFLGLVFGPASRGVAATLSQGQVGNVDVTQFSVLWHVDGEGKPGLDVFSDEAGTVSLNGQVGVEFYPIEMNDLQVPQTAGDRVLRRTLQDQTRAKGLVLARVTSAQPGTTYHVRPRSFDSTTGNANETAPAPLLSVKTAATTAFVLESRQLTVHLGACFAGTEGAVMRLNRTGSAYPLFAVVGDAAEMDEVFFDLSRLLNLAGTTHATLTGQETFALELLGTGGPSTSHTVEVTFTGAPVVAAAKETVFASSFPGLAYFSMETVNTPVVGYPFRFDITARNAQGEVLTGFNGTVELSATEPSVLTSGGGTTPAFVNGRLSNHAVVASVTGPVTLQADRSCGIETGSQSFVFVSPEQDIRFSIPVYKVNQGATTVALTLTRTATEPAEFVLNTHDGTAQTGNPPFAGALAGVDYADLTGAATQVNFAQGQTDTTVNVTLMPQTGNVTNRRFTATLQAPGETPVLASTQVQILADDILLPKLTVTTPAANARSLSSVRPYTVSGKAEDLRGIDRVEVILNGATASPVIAVLGAATKPGSVPFTADISPTDGLNTLEVVAYDLRNNRVAVSRTFTFAPRYWLTLNRSVPAATASTPDRAGTLTLKASVPANASALTPKGAALQRSMVVPNTVITLTATAKPNHVFSHWTGAPQGADIRGNGISFTMPQGDLPQVTAVFITNPFPALIADGAKPTYQGLLLPASTTPASNGTVGLVTGTLAPATGALSGKVWMDGKVTAFVAQIQGNGEAWFRVGKTLAPSFPFLNRHLTMSWSAAQGLSLQVVGANSTLSQGVARMPAYSRKVPAPAALLDATGRSGYYTLALPAKAQTPVRDSSSYPQGAGYKTLTLASDGTVKFAGLLADGSKITASSYLASGDEAVFFLQLPTPGAATKGGSFLGTLQFAVAANQDVSATDMLWFRPAVPETAKPVTWLYTEGWESGVKLDAVGALYNKTVNVQTTLGLGDAAETGNARLHFSEGKLVSPLAWLNFNIAGSAVKKLPVTDKTFTLTVTQGTGLISGTFTPNWLLPAKALPKFQGVLLQKGTNRRGQGFFLSTALNDRNPQSGAVLLGQPGMANP